MEQNPLSDESILRRIDLVLHESEDRKHDDDRSVEESTEKYHDVSDYLPNNITTEAEKKRRLEIENQLLATQLETERRKSRELQSKFDLLENSFKSFEKLNGQLEAIKQTVDEEIKLDFSSKCFSEGLQKLRPKTVHTAPSGNLVLSQDENEVSVKTSGGEPRGGEVKGSKISLHKMKNQVRENKDEAPFRDAEDFRQLDEGMEIVRDNAKESEPEKVFITKTEARCFEDIGQLAARTRPPLDEKHQRFFERDRKKFSHRIMMPETQEIEKTEFVPPDIISKTKETPVNITSTELDGLRSYLIQLKELIARRETAWARTTERDYNQRVEITRFKNEVSHLRMLCEKRQKDIKERDQIIALRDETINDLQKRVKALKNAVMKLEKKDERIMDTLDGLTNEVLENSQIVQRSYNAMKRTSMLKNSSAGTGQNVSSKTAAPNPYTGVSGKSRDFSSKKKINDKSSPRKMKTSNDEDCKLMSDKSKSRLSLDRRQKSMQYHNRDTMEKVDEKLQKIEEMIHAEVLKENKKVSGNWKAAGKNQASNELKNLIRNNTIEKGTGDVEPSFQRKVTPSSSKMRQEMLVVMSGMNNNMNLGPRPGVFTDTKKPQVTAAILQNALFAARNANMFNK